MTTGHILIASGRVPKMTRIFFITCKNFHSGRYAGCQARSFHPEGKGIEGFDCNEGMLQWIPKKDIFSLNLWEGDQYFLWPLVEGKQDIEMTCVYEGDHLVKYE